MKKLQNKLATLEHRIKLKKEEERQVKYWASSEFQEAQAHYFERYQFQEAQARKLAISNSTKNPADPKLLPPRPPTQSPERPATEKEMREIVGLSTEEEDPNLGEKINKKREAWIAEQSQPQLQQKTNLPNSKPPSSDILNLTPAQEAKRKRNKRQRANKKRRLQESRVATSNEKSAEE